MYIKLCLSDKQQMLSRWSDL